LSDSTLRVSADSGIDPDAIPAIEEAFRQAGLDAEVKPNLLELSHSAEWILIITSAPTAFMTAYAAKAGSDAWDATKRGSGRLVKLVRDLKAANGGQSDGSIEVQDGNRQWLVLGSDTPEEALQQLEDIDLTVAESGYLRWDAHRQCWMHVDPGAEPQPAPKRR
jgi:hypothetical protein